MTQAILDREAHKTLKLAIRQLSEFNALSTREVLLHFQTMISARVNKVFMEAPGLYYPDIPLYVISLSGINRGHTSMNNSIIEVLPEGKRTAYAFVLYPESFVRSCFDRVLRKTAKKIVPDLRLSMENVFNRKHYPHSLVDSQIEADLVAMLRKDVR